MVVSLLHIGLLRTVMTCDGLYSLAKRHRRIKFVMAFATFGEPRHWRCNHTMSHNSLVWVGASRLIHVMSHFLNRPDCIYYVVCRRLAPEQHCRAMEPLFWCFYAGAALAWGTPMPYSRPHQAGSPGGAITRRGARATSWF